MKFSQKKYLAWHIFKKCCLFFFSFLCNKKKFRKG